MPNTLPEHHISHWIKLLPYHHFVPVKFWQPRATSHLLNKDKIHAMPLIGPLRFLQNNVQGCWDLAGPLKGFVLGFGGFLCGLIAPVQLFHVLFFQNHYFVGNCNSQGSLETLLILTFLCIYLLKIFWVKPRGECKPEPPSTRSLSRTFRNAKAKYCFNFGVTWFVNSLIPIGSPSHWAS